MSFWRDYSKKWRQKKTCCLLLPPCEPVMPLFLFTNFSFHCLCDGLFSWKIAAHVSANFLMFSETHSVKPDGIVWTFCRNNQHCCSPPIQQLRRPLDWNDARFPPLFPFELHPRTPNNFSQFLCETSCLDRHYCNWSRSTRSHATSRFY